MNKFSIDLKKKRIQTLRSLKNRNSVIPNIKAKLWASRILDELTNKQSITLPDDAEDFKVAEPMGKVGEEESLLRERKEKIPPLQKHWKEGLVIAGTDVEALYPSLKDIESGRIARDAVLESRAESNNVDYEAGLRYLLVVGGREHLVEAGLSRLIPRWKGKRPDMLTVGGEALTDKSKWAVCNKETLDWEKRKIISLVVEAAVVVCMSTHAYRFGEHLYLQQHGGPIGMRFTASLAGVVMKMWDKQWEKLMRREGLEHFMFVRYVDDCRLILPALNKGWTWNGNRFIFDMNMVDNGETDDEYTTREITNAMCSLVDFLKFTGECCDMFGGSFPHWTLHCGWRKRELCSNFMRKRLSAT